MAACEYYQELMDRLMDEGLSAEEEADLREHLRTCPDCARLFSALSAMTVALRENQVEPPKVLTGRVMARIRASQAEAWEAEAEQEEKPRRQSRVRRAEKPARAVPTLWVRVAAAACLAVLVGGVAVTTLRGRMGAKDNSSEAAVVRSADAGAGEAIEEEAALDMADGAPAPAVDLQVYDISGDPIGYIPLENIPDFEELLTDDGDPGEDMEVLCTVEYNGTQYDFATDEQGKALAWWDPTDDKPHLSPGTWPQLRELIVSTVNTEAGQ